jgi:hypothetical protein
LTEREWDAARDPFALLSHLFPMRGDDSTELHARASKLYLIACARKAWDRLPVCGRELIVLAEFATDREGITDELRREARSIAEDLVNCPGEPDDLNDIEQKLRAAGHRFESGAKPQRTYDRDEWRSLSHLVYLPYAKLTPNYRHIAAEDHSIELIRDAFPSPFRDPRIAPEHRTRTVAALAREMYRSRDFSPLPLLADALQDAGCRNPYVLNHCNSPGPHTRGCWVVEAILHPPRLMITRT